MVLQTFYFLLAVNDSFCDGKFDGFYQDPNECQAFYQCLKGKASKRYCLKGMVFNPTLKTCDNPDNFPCRVIEGSEPSALETKRPEVIPDPLQGEQSTPGNAIGSSTSGIDRASLGALTPERVTPRLSLCNSIFTFQVIFNIIFEHFFPRKWKHRSVCDHVCASIVR